MQAMGILGQIRELRRREKKETTTVRGNVIPSNSINGDGGSAGEGGWRNGELRVPAEKSFISAGERGAVVARPFPHCPGRDFGVEAALGLLRRMKSRRPDLSQKPFEFR